ncbi:hypothetical protein VM98_34280, partial [Streptomyces rubellomurinus subsp. indigoferus]
YIEPLAARHPVIAVDTLGEPVAGVQTSPVRAAHQAADGPDEPLAAPDVPPANVAGAADGAGIPIHPP